MRELSDAEIAPMRLRLNRMTKQAATAFKAQQDFSFAAFQAVIAVDAAVQFQNLFAAGCLVEPVDVLGDDGFQPALRLPLRQLFMGGVGLWRPGPAAWPGRSGKILRGCFRKMYGLKSPFRRIFPFLVI